MRGKFISYLRVSTDKQGERGYGMAAQKKAVTDFLNGGNWELLGEFVEVESGKHNDRPELAKALAACRKHKAKLVIAKLDRLARNVAFIANLMDGRVDFVCCDMPQATRLTIHVLAAVAEHEREMIAKRTKEGLAAAKVRGVQLGNSDLARANKAAAIERAKALAPMFAELDGKPAREIARILNDRKVATPAGGSWHAATVNRVRERLSLQGVVAQR
jgi:DNA invertase Pin-like site-specific DNA recombinase